jgi:hypothetical protein
MPLTGEAKLEWNKRYRAQSIKNGYGKWLYARRKARFVDAEKYQEALLKIAACDDLKKAKRIARDALRASIKRHEKIGPSPYSSRNDPEMHREFPEGETIEQALKRMGL